MKVYLFLFYSIISSFFAVGQKYDRADAVAGNIGALNSFNVAQIADTLTQSFSTKEEKARAIFYWIAHHIEPDLKASRYNDNKKVLPEDVIQSRKGTPLGFANLFQEMLSRANIRCLTVDGYIKRNASDINNLPDDPNHTWNVVQLGTSNEAWLYVDVFLAAGNMDSRFTRFIPNFNKDYFFTPYPTFNLQHFPDNPVWQFGSGFKSKKEFFNAPVVTGAGISLGIFNVEPARGVIKTKTKNAVNFIISFQNDVEPKEIFMVTGDDKRPDKPKPVKFSTNEGRIQFQYLFERDDEYPCRIVIDGAVVLEYMVDAIE